MHARVLKFHIWIAHGKIADPYFFLSELSLFLELCPFEKNQNEILSVVRYLEKYLSLGLETTNSVKIVPDYGPLKIRAF